LTLPERTDRAGLWTGRDQAPTLIRGSVAGEARGDYGGGVQMTDLVEELIEDELTEEDLDEVEALGAAEDADRILGEIDA
jgi:hypothetical protein